MSWTRFVAGSRLDEQLLQPPTGQIVSFGGLTAPIGWLLCDGSELLRTDYTALDAVIGTSFGSYTNGSGAAGTTHFRLPDLRGRVALGSGSGAGLSVRALGTSGGTETVTLTATQTGVAAHSHTVTESNHTHTLTETAHKHGIQMDFPGNADGASTHNRPREGGANGLLYTLNSVSQGFSVTAASANVTVNQATPVAASTAHTNVQPSVVVSFLIKT